LQGLSTHDEGRLTALPILRRSDLMNDFEAGLCAPHPSADEIKVWLAEPARVGARIEDRWQVWESSGTQGQPGWFVQDEAALAVYDALESLRGAGASAWDTLSGGHRMALLVATGGHFASIASFERLRREAPWMAERMRAFSILQPLPALVQALNDWQPSVLATYPTAATLLAEQARAGHLNLRLRALWSGGETLRPAQRLPGAQQLRGLGVLLHRQRVRAWRPAPECRLGDPGAGRCRGSAGADRRLGANDAADQSRQSRAAPDPLRAR
jgi:phenylacetate-coenzyme A ligase PaaK-like adenylate-forming protein